MDKERITLPFENGNVIIACIYVLEKEKGEKSSPAKRQDFFLRSKSNWKNCALNILLFTNEAIGPSLESVALF